MSEKEPDVVYVVKKSHTFTVVAIALVLQMIILVSAYIYFDYLPRKEYEAKAEQSAQMLIDQVTDLQSSLSKTVADVQSFQSDVTQQLTTFNRSLSTTLSKLGFTKVGTR